MYCIREDDCRYLVMSLCDISYEDEILLADLIDYGSKPWRFGRPGEEPIEYKIRLEYKKKDAEAEANTSYVGGINDLTGKDFVNCFTEDNESESSSADAENWR